MAEINIVIPVFNGKKYLTETVNSILKQSFGDFEAFFIDDGSNDGSIELLEKFAEKDSRIKLIQKPHEGSVPYAWNYIFPMLMADWTLYMSHDDLLASDLLQKLMEKQIQTGADAVIPTCHFFSSDISDDVYAEKNKLNDMGKRSVAGSITGHEAFELMLDYTIPGFALWRTSIIRNLGMPTEAYNSDEGMQRIWAQNCDKVAFSSAKFYYRLIPGSITRGLKPYHYTSLLTNMRLLDAARAENISPTKLRQFQYHCMSSLFYLKAQAKSNVSQYTSEEIASINTIFSSVYSSFKYDIPSPKSVKELNLSLCAKSKRYLSIASTLFSQKLKS